MRINTARLGIGWLGLLLVVFPASAATRYVNVNSANPVAPYTNWATASTTIQEAIDAADPGDIVLVTNGVYANGGKAVQGTMTNRVAVDKALTLQSVNGPDLTIIKGYQLPGTITGTGAIRCVYLTNGAALHGFALTNGATQSGRGFDESGGGVRCEGVSAVVSNCVITGNSAARVGGGTHSGTLNNCTLADNSSGYLGGGANESTLNNCVLTGNSASFQGGGAYSGTLNNCTVTGNTANFGGGAYQGSLNNCIVYYNNARVSGANYSGNTFSARYSCTTPLPAGPGNIDAEPQLASASHVSADSPCIGSGSAAHAGGVDVDGEPWANLPAIGCDELWSGSVTGALNVAAVAAPTNVAVGFEVDFEAIIGGRVSTSRWDFGDGTVVSNRPYPSHAWVTAGDYVVELRAYNESHPEGVAASVTVHVEQEELYVALDSVNPVPPYSSWVTAARNIQDAVDAATLPGALVWVANGVYETGARAVNGTSNRLAVTKPVAVRSVNGPEVTIIQGYQVPGTTNGAEAVRCVYLTNEAVLAGFTLTGGASQGAGGAGGGVYCEAWSAVVSNCVLTGNSASLGGGAHDGTLNNCLISGNSASYGGGVSYATLNNCVLTGNSATFSGGGAYDSSLNQCTLTGNSAYWGGGAFFSTLNNRINNSIIYYNSAANGANYHGQPSTYFFTFSCTTPFPWGTGNFTSVPLFMDTNDWSDLRLQSNSPCINAGNNAYFTSAADLDGNARIVDGTVDIGAYEFQGRIRYVSLTSINPVSPYSDWSIAATNIQDAIDAAVVGDTVLVTNGVYATGGKAVYGLMTNRVAVDKPLTLMSVSGPEFTIIQGYQVPTSIVGDGAIRCVYLTNGALLEGFTLSLGATRIGPRDFLQGVGAGLWCETTNAYALNCIISNCVADYAAGGAYRGTLEGCTLVANFGAYGGGARESRLNQCVLMGNSTSGYGGGALNSTLDRCLVTGNSASSGGGASSCVLSNCLVVGNFAVRWDGGGAKGGTLINCTVAGNTAARSAGGADAGVYHDCIVYANSAPTHPNYLPFYTKLNYTCTEPLPDVGIGNITNPPLFADTNGWADLRLQSNSPCINAGNNAYVTSTNDLDGNPRIVGGTVDMGAYETQSPQSVISYAWLQQYGLPTDGSADYAHSDADPHNNWQEWKAWTNPTNGLSVLRMLSALHDTNGAVVRWESVAGHSYQIERATDANTPFSTLHGGIVGEAGTTSFLDTTATNGDILLYRVGVK